MTKFLSMFLLGALVMFGVLWFAPQLLGYKQPLGIKTNVLGAETIVEEDKVKGFVQTAINVVISHFVDSEAAAPLVETTQSVQKAVTDVQTLPDNQKAAICREICAP
jgi:hypothetical protein